MSTIVDELVQIIRAQQDVLAAYRLGKRPTEKALRVLDHKDEVLRRATQANPPQFRAGVTE